MTTHSYRHSIPEDILALSHQRDLLRRRGQYDRADILKRQLEEAGYAVKDNPRGAHLVILPSIEVDGTTYRTARQLPSLLDEPDLSTFSIVILAQNDATEPRRCVESVLRFAGDTNIEIMLIDNSSRDELHSWASILQEQDPRLHVLRTSRVMGKAEALNIGLKQSRGHYILLLDSSLELKGDILTPLEHTLQTPNVGLTGAHGLSTDDLRHFEESTNHEVEAITGTCMAFPRRLLKQTGLLDERFRLPQYMDIDFSFAIRDTGVDAVLTSQLPLLQHPTTEGDYPDAEYTRLTKRNFYRYLDKWGNREDLLLD
jgi:glycosyltransferase involved in cell wall biosynthesis